MPDQKSDDELREEGREDARKHWASIDAELFALKKLYRINFYDKSIGPADVFRIALKMEHEKGLDNSRLGSTASDAGVEQLNTLTRLYRDVYGGLP